LLDVAIIGGGPVGSRAAHQLAGMGYGVGVFEKRAAIGQKSCCTGIVSQECVQHFDIPESVILKQVSSASVFSPSGEFIQVSKPEPQAAILDRSLFDRDLADKARTKGAKYHLDSRVEDISFSPDSAHLKFNDFDGAKEVEARAVILACGFSSPLIKRLKLGSIDFMVTGAQIEVETNGINGVEVYFDQDLAPGYFAWLVPITNKKSRIGLLTCESPGKKLKDWMATLEAKGRVVAGKSVIRYGGIPLKPLSRTYADRLIIAGDAAGQVKSTTGGGIYFGLLCADIAADTIDKAIQSSDLSAANLACYERNWRKKLSHELRVEYMARKFYQRLNNQQIDSLFNRLKSANLVDYILKEKNISFDWHGDLLLMGLKMGLKSEISRLIKLPRF
jgi:digeranylgeranylglycerophospholipid reductase